MAITRKTTGEGRSRLLWQPPEKIVIQDSFQKLFEQMEKKILKKEWMKDF